MGEIAARLADVVVVTDDNPRSEDPAAIRAEIVAGRSGYRRRRRRRDRRPARRDPVRRSSCSRAGDAVLIAGKGHETGQEVGGSDFPFDDKAEAPRRALERRVARRERAGVIALTLGRDRRTSSPARSSTATPTSSSPARRPSTPDGSPAAASSSPSRASTSTGTTSPQPRSQPARSPCSRRARSECRPSSCPTRSRRSDGLPITSSSQLTELTVIGITGSQGKTSTKDMRRPAARAQRRDRRAGRQPQQRDRRAR